MTVDYTKLNGTYESGANGGHVIQDNGSDKTDRKYLNFIGATVADDSINNATKITISGGGGGLSNYFLVHQVAGGKTISSTPGVTILDTESIDSGSDYDLVSGLYTVPSTGIYEFWAQITTATPTEAGQVIVTIVVAPATVYGYGLGDMSIGIRNSVFIYTGPLSLTASDQVALVATWSGTNPIGLVSGSPYSNYFTGRKIA